MARDRGRRGRDASRADESPVDQLETWRSWRHDDTAEFPAVPAADPVEREPDDELAAVRRHRPGTGFLVGAALLLAALAVSGLAAAGVGPVAHLLGSGNGNDHPSGTTRTPSSAASTAAGSGSPAAGTSSAGAATSTSSGAAAPGGAAAPTTGAPAPGGPAASGADPGPAGTAAPRPGGGPAGGPDGNPPQPPAGGPGA